MPEDVETRFGIDRGQTLQAQMARVCVGMQVGALLRMLIVLEPDQDWTVLRQACRHLKQCAVPSRDKLGSMIPADELLDLGLRLMEACEDGPEHVIYRATKYRDGLIIPVLICCPIRLANLQGLEIGRHLLFDGLAYLIELTASETKTHRPYRATLPAELTACVDRYLEVWRPLMARASPARAGTEAERRLWLDRHGRPRSKKAIRRQIESRTRKEFGRAVWPHLFHDCAVTELVDSAPEEIWLAPDLLGHTRLETTRKHYIQGQGMTAHLRVQEMIAARRRAATARERSGA